MKKSVVIGTQVMPKEKPAYVLKQLDNNVIMGGSPKLEQKAALISYINNNIIKR